MHFILRTVATALALILVAYLLPGIEVTGIYPAIIAALILGLLNAIVRPILIFLTLPVTIVTLGLFIFVINAVLFSWVATFVDGFEITGGFLASLIGSILVSIVSSLMSKIA